VWTRADLKYKAKEVLKQTYWSALGVSLILAIANGDFKFENNLAIRYKESSFYWENFGYEFLVNRDTIKFIIFIAIITLLIRIVILYSLEIGATRYFVQTAQYKTEFTSFSFPFKKGNTASIVKTMFVKDILIFLWSLLLIIPGIIKGYAYRMVPYILADNPNIGVNRALELSNKMTYGHKFEMFVLDLSFIGWYFLGLLACGIGIIFVYPYQYATNTQLYLVLRQNALDRYWCSYEELLLDRDESDNYYGW